MHGLADEAEFHHRAFLDDEPRVRGAARGGELAAAMPVSASIGLGDEIRRRRSGGVRKATALVGSNVQAVADVVAGRLPQAPAISSSRVSGVQMIVEADVERGAGLGGDDVGGRIADVDRGDLEVRGVEMLGAARPAARAGAPSSRRIRPGIGLSARCG